MIAILDTNTITKKFNFNNSSLRIILYYAEKNKFQLIVPEVVYLEVINQVREEFSQVADANNERIRKIRKSIDSYFGELITQNDIDEEVEKYKQFIKNLFNKANVVIHPIPTIPHKQIIERDLKRRKPFNKAGKGYRDALIWESILEVLQNKKKFILYLQI